MRLCVIFALICTTFAATSYEEKCTKDPEVGLCKALLPRWWFNVRTHQCEEFFYGGCGGNENRYETKEECEKTCADEKPIERPGGLTEGLLYASIEDVCRRPPYTGYCLAFLPRFYYDATTNSCKPFVYGGCHSNGNNFETRRDCLDFCSPPVATQPTPSTA
ncbi:thrombin inhibitor hemalin-like [Amblyomma americanum]